MLHMAKSTENKAASVAPVAASGESPTPAASPTTPIITPPVAESFDSFLDRQGDALAAKGQTPSGDKPKADDQAAPESEAEPELKPDEAKPEGEEDTDKVEEEEGEEQSTEGEAETPPDARIELGVEKELTDKGVSPALRKRLKGLFKSDIELKSALAERDSILATKDSEIETLKGQLTEAGGKATIIPSGPLAHLDSTEKLDQATKDATHNLQWASNPVGFEQHFQDDPETVPVHRRRTADEKFEAFKEYQLQLLANAPEQARINAKRQATRESLKKTRPEFFKPDHEEAKAFASFFASDPRTREDADQLAADAIRGRREREEEATGKIKYHRTEIQPLKPSVKDANGDKASDSENGEVRSPKAQVKLPSARPVTRVPTKTEGKPRLQQLAEQATSGGHTYEDYVDAQMEAAAA